MGRWPVFVIFLSAGGIIYGVERLHILVRSSSFGLLRWRNILESAQCGAVARHISAVVIPPQGGEYMD